MKKIVIFCILVFFVVLVSGTSILKKERIQKNVALITSSKTTYSNQLEPENNNSYVYDHFGRIILSKSVVYRRIYTYSASEIVEKYEDTNGKNNVIIMHHKLDTMGRIVSSVEPSIRINYSYSKDGYLHMAKVSHASDPSNRGESKYIIADGNLQRIEKNNNGDLDTVRLSASVQSFPANFHYLIRDLPFEFTGVLRSYYGKPLKKLIAKAEITGLSPVFYSYKKDADGNVIEAKSRVTYEKTEVDLTNIKYTSHYFSKINH